MMILFIAGRMRRFPWEAGKVHRSCIRIQYGRICVCAEYWDGHVHYYQQ